MPNPAFIHMNGELVPFEDARVHVLSPAMKYGALVFEGICGYWNEKDQECYVFRLRDHLVRLRNSMRILRFAAEYELDRLAEIVGSTVAANELRSDIHIRLSAWVDGDGTMDSAGPIGIMCAALPRGPRSLDSRAASGTISNWRRIDDRSMPPRVKSAANYSNSRLAQMQAKLDGYDEAILLGVDGKICEGTGACFFMVRDGVVVTPPVTSGILESVTRATLLELVQSSLKLPVQERAIDRTEAYVAEEAFLCGSGYEITPLLSIDRIDVGNGRIGEVTCELWARYEEVVRGTIADYPAWRTPVFAGDRKAAAAA